MSTIIYIVWESDGECRNFIGARSTPEKAEQLKYRQIQEWKRYCDDVKKKDGLDFFNLCHYEVEEYKVL